MKKIILSALIVCGFATANAQLNTLSKAKAIAGAAGVNTSVLSNGIMEKLAPALSLTTAQKPKVGNAVTSYLTSKEKILPLQSSDPTAYAQKQSGLFGNLKTKLAGILLKNQMNKFLGLKPATNNPANVLSQLFF